MSDDVILTCALTGARSKRECPAVPTTPQEYAREARRARDAGAAIVHLHARNPETGAPSQELEHFRLAVDAVRDAVPDLIVNITTGGIGHSREARIAPCLQLKPDFAAISMGSFNFALFDEASRKFRYDVVFGNPFSDICFFLQSIQATDTRPDYECYEIGHIDNVELAAKTGLNLAGMYSLILGIDGAIKATPENLGRLVSALPKGVHWDVVVTRFPEQWPLIAAAMNMGGSVRVGLEDNPFLEEGVMARSNGELVAKAALMAREAGRTVVPPSRAREILGLDSARLPGCR